MELGRYRKLIAAAIGIAALIFAHHFQVDIPGLQPVMIDLVVGGLTTLGVYQVANDE